MAAFVGLWPSRWSAFQIVAFAALVAAVAQVSLGSVVRVSGSGLGCPDWPLCHGQIIPPLEYHTLVEYSHRLLASVVGLLVLTLAVMAWRGYRSHRPVVLTSTLALGLVIVVASLGGAAVLTELAWWTVLLHLGFAEATIGCIVVVWVATARPAGDDVGVGPMRRYDRFDLLASGTLVAVLALILYGSYVVGKGYGSSCPSWPMCNGGLVPEGTAYSTHMAHRFLAVAVGVLVAWTAWAAWLRRASMPRLTAAALALATLFGSQVLLGAATVWSGFDDALRALHLGVATLVWVIVVLVAALNFESRLILARAPMAVASPASGAGGVAT